MQATNSNCTSENFEELNCRLEAVEAQRNRALTDAAIAHGKLAMAQAKLAETNKEIEQIKANAAALNAKLIALVTTQEA
jgi:hypothetical protein